jgi:triphosphoribosyl-dephospho-CoA synthetase
VAGFGAVAPNRRYGIIFHPKDLAVNWGRVAGTSMRAIAMRRRRESESRCLTALASSLSKAMTTLADSFNLVQHDFR